MSHNTSRHLLVAASLLAAPLGAQAVDLSSRIFGLGAMAPITDRALQPPALSIRFAPSARFVTALQLGVGVAPVFDTANNNALSGVEAIFTPGLQLDWVLIPEEHMNLQLGLGVTMDLRSSSGVKAVDYRLGPGVELFFSDFPHLGVTAQFGLAGSVGSNDASESLLRTGFSPFGATGIHYYF